MTFIPSINDAGPAESELQPSTTNAAGLMPSGSAAPCYDGATAPDVVCPCCRGNLIRIWRRPSDRLLSMFIPLHRYRCDAHDCRWEGNIRRSRTGRVSAARGSRAPNEVPENRIPAAFVMHMALVVIGVLFVFAVAYVDWSSPGDDWVDDTTWRISDRVGVPDVSVPVTGNNDK
jgi:hypothetical protein